MDVKLVMFKTNGQRKDIPLTNPTSIIGRAENCDFRIPLLSVSRRHCELTMSANTIQVKDLASSNGTYVNNKRVTETKLKAGDRLVVGPVVFTLQIDGVPGDIKPVKTRGEKVSKGPLNTPEDILGLEADLVGDAGASSTGSSLGLADSAEESAIDLDPISAMESQSGSADKKKPKKK